MSGLQCNGQELDGGFTLIELLVVIIIIGILAAIALPIYLQQKEKGYEAGMRSDLRTTASEMELYWSENGSYPATLGPTTTPTIGQDSFALSPGDTVQLIPVGTDGTIAGTYCIKMTSSHTPNYITYDSDKGGTQHINTPCS